MTRISQRERNADLVSSFKCEGCLCCEEHDPELIQIHHVDRLEKSFVIGSRSSHVSTGRLVAELAKCVPLCPTCHYLADRYPDIISREDPDDDYSPYVCRRRRGVAGSPE